MIAKVRNQTLDSFAGLGVVTHDTMDEYRDLSQEEKMDGNVHLVLENEPINANIVEYTDDKTVKDELDDIDAQLPGLRYSNSLNSGTWFNSVPQGNTSVWFYYEGADVTAMNLPFPHCFVEVCSNGGRAMAVAYSWAGYARGRMWINSYQDTWLGWKEITGSISVPATPAVSYSGFITCRRTGDGTVSVNINISYVAGTVTAGKVIALIPAEYAPSDGYVGFCFTNDITTVHFLSITPSGQIVFQGTGLGNSTSIAITATYVQ